MNDCDEKAECIPSGLQYKCVCGRGTNDTSNGKGHSCEGVLIADANLYNTTILADALKHFIS
uniref:EGF-like domain-containing protein n=1 Tax=Ascaris lumbricoides TaxID=6252 RepID=A0A0M3HSE0_ASCLU